MKYASQTAAATAGNSVPIADGITADGGQSPVAREYHAFLSDVETLVSTASSMTATELARAKDRLVDYVSSAKASVGKVGSAVIDGTRNGAKATDRYVRDQPWQAVGMTAVAGLLIGFLLGRRSS